MMTYQEQIKHPKWQKKRLQVLNAHKFKCQVCGAKEEELHVHHPYYKRGAMIWEYKKEELECLCFRCHKNAHAIDEKIKKALALCPDKQRVLDFILQLDAPVLPAPITEAPPKMDLYELDLRGQAEQDDIELENHKKEYAALYSEYPHLAPMPDDTPEQQAYKFFAKMKLLTA